MKKNKKSPILTKPLAEITARAIKEGYDEAMMRVLKKIKEDTGLTYPKMSELAGVSVITLTRWFTVGIGKVHRATRIQITRFIKDYQKDKEAGTMGKYMKGGRI